MKKKSYVENSDENEYDVDEPEEIQNNATDDDWTPANDNLEGRRTSSRIRSLPRSRAPIIDPSSSDESGEESVGKRKPKSKGRGRPAQPIKKLKTVSSSTSIPVNKTNNSIAKSSSSEDSEPSSTTTTNNTPKTTTSSVSSSSPGASGKVNKDFTSGAFVILKSDAGRLDEDDPPLWKIDGKALLQKYMAFQQEGKTLYKNTSVYSGWTIHNKENYLPVTVTFKQQTRKDHIVEFDKSQVKLDKVPDNKKGGKNSEKEVENGKGTKVEKENDNESEENENSENSDEEEDEEEDEDDDEKDDDDDDDDDGKDDDDDDDEKEGEGDESNDDKK